MCVQPMAAGVRRRPLSALSNGPLFGCVAPHTCSALVSMVSSSRGQLCCVRTSAHKPPIRAGVSRAGPRTRIGTCAGAGYPCFCTCAGTCSVPSRRGYCVRGWPVCDVHGLSHPKYHRHHMSHRSATMLCRLLPIVLHVKIASSGFCIVATHSFPSALQVLFPMRGGQVTPRKGGVCVCVCDDPYAASRAFVSMCGTTLVWRPRRGCRGPTQCPWFVAGVARPRPCCAHQHTAPPGPCAPLSWQSVSRGTCWHLRLGWGPGTPSQAMSAGPYWGW